jgi:O-antigen ligase
MIILLAMIGTNSRGAFLGIGVALILILIANFNVKRLVFSIIIVILVFSRVSSVHWERYDTIDLDIEQWGTGGQRIATWNTAIRMMTANPILGVGTGEYPNNFNRYATYDDQVKVGGVIGEETINTHNTTLQVGSENGFLGLGLYALIIFFCFWEMKRVLKICRGKPELEDLKQMTKTIGIAIIAFFVTAQLGNAGYSLGFYTLLSLSISSRIIAEREKEGVGKNLEEQMLLNIIPHQYQNIFRILLVVMFSYICIQA